MSPDLQNFVAAVIMALASTFSGIGAGATYYAVAGDGTKATRLEAMMIGVIMMLCMLNAQIWFGYHGFMYQR